MAGDPLVFCAKVNNLTLEELSQIPLYLTINGVTSTVYKSGYLDELIYEFDALDDIIGLQGAEVVFNFGGKSTSFTIE